MQIFLVGIVLGLQKLAANYVSGLVILAEHSLRIGDVVKDDAFEGQITDIKMRYTVIRAVNGRESIVPNELLITNRIENCSFADPKVALTKTVQVAYGTDLAALMPKPGEAVKAVPRVIAEPAPSVQLSQFAADGLELNVVFWIADSDKGTGNVRSDVNLALLAAITAAGVEIPFPQRRRDRAIRHPPVRGPVFPVAGGGAVDPCREQPACGEGSRPLASAGLRRVPPCIGREKAVALPDPAHGMDPGPGARSVQGRGMRVPPFPRNRWHSASAGGCNMNGDRGGCGKGA